LTVVDDYKLDDIKATEENPRGQLPMLTVENEGNLYGLSAILRYVARSGQNSQYLLGSIDGNFQQGMVDSWLEYSEKLQHSVNDWTYPILKLRKFDGKSSKEGKTASMEAVALLEEYFVLNTFAVGHFVSLADIALCGSMKRLFDLVLGEEVRDDHPHVERWYTFIRNQPEFQAFGEITFVAVEQVAEIPQKGGKKQKGQQQPKKQKEKKEEETGNDEEDEEDKPKKKKEKNVLDLLPASSTGMSMDATKRLFSNEDFSTAIGKFWETWDNEGFSLYMASYNYNDENRIAYMTGNLIGGFVQRLDLLRPYGYGVLNIMGVNEDSPPFPIITAWIFRGKGIPFEMRDCSDYELYTWVELNTDNHGDRQRFEELWAAEIIDGLPVIDRRFFK